jgi:predicted nucleic acid-binding Zn ribbon protein
MKLGRTRLLRKHSHCVKVGCVNLIPESKRSDAKYCSDNCKDAAEKKRYCDRHPDYVKRQRRKVNEIRHTRTYGHTDYLDAPMKNPNDRYAHARAKGYRSGLEVEVARSLDAKGVKYGYETLKIEWVDLKYRSYTPDYILMNGIIIETKGLFTSEDRRKHLEIQRQHPELDIRFVFSNVKAKLYKGSKTTYAMWCEKQGFQYAHRVIPLEWLEEKGTPIKAKRIKLKAGL